MIVAEKLLSQESQFGNEDAVSDIEVLVAEKLLARSRKSIFDDDDEIFDIDDIVAEIDEGIQNGEFDDDWDVFTVCTPTLSPGSESTPVSVCVICPNQAQKSASAPAASVSDTYSVWSEEFLLLPAKELLKIELQSSATATRRSDEALKLQALAEKVSEVRVCMYIYCF